MRIVTRIVEVMVELPVVVQPRLLMSAETAAAIVAGHAYQIGGVVREVGTGRLVELLRDAPNVDEVVGEVGQRLAKRLPGVEILKFELPKVDSKTAAVAAGALVVAGLAVGGSIWVAGRRKADAAPLPAELVVEELVDANAAKPECLVDFRASLKRYVEAGANGVLTSKVVSELLNDLDAVQAYSEDGNAVVFTLEELEPFFVLVTSHTPVLAKAYGIQFDDDEDTHTDDVVVSLRRHLETQERILSGAA